MTENVVGKKMVAGFLFAGNFVLLVEKQKPIWQKGLLNGVGGVIEQHETPLDAMRREFHEETKCSWPLEWRHFATEIEPFGAYVYFFTASMGEGNIDGHDWPENNDVGEPLQWKHVPKLNAGAATIGNLRWLIPLALDWRNLEPMVVHAHGDIREKASW